MGAAADRSLDAPRHRRLSLQQIAVFTCAALSAAFVVVDALGGGLNVHRLDLGIELIARVLMLVLAALAASKVLGRQHLELLLWSVLCVSFDTYWQTTYRHIGGRPLEWTEMIVKYVATGVGLGLLLRLCAEIADDGSGRLRRFIAKWWFVPAGALAAAGLVHGILYIQSCYFFVPGRDQCIISERALLALDAYLVLDALIRIAIVAVAVTGYVQSSPSRRERTFLVAVSSCVFALGAAIDFLARLGVSYDTAIVLQVFDAVTTLQFPLALLYVGTRNQFYGVRYAFKIHASRALASTIVLALWYVTSIVVELTLHKRMTTTFRWLPLNEEYVEYAVGLPFLLMWKPVEKKLEGAVEGVLMRDRLKRRQHLRDLIHRIPYIDDLVVLEKHLHRALTDGVNAKFADIFVHAGQRRFGTYLSSREPGLPQRHEVRAPFLHAKEPPVPAVCNGENCSRWTNPVIPDGKLAVPMPGGGKPYGILVFGPPADGERKDFDREEIDQLDDFGAIAGSALYALRSNKKRAPRTRRPAVSVPPLEEVL